MHLNTIAGRTYNDLSQYPVVSVFTDAVSVVVMRVMLLPIHRR